ncbi:MAG: metal-dependent transcriptional regulator [Thermoprotei archaeon]
MSKRVSRRAEEYLEAIYELISKGEKPGIRKLAKLLGVKPSSVLEYIRRLCREGLLKYEDGKIEFTNKGFQIAQEIRKRHELIKEFLILIGVSEDIADQDACYIEHGVHEETLNKIMEFVKKYRESKCI